MTGWRRVTKQSPCPVCGKPKWCSVSVDGEIAKCMKVESDTRTKDNGWLHRLQVESNGFVEIGIAGEGILVPASGIVFVWDGFVHPSDVASLSRADKLTFALGADSVVGFRVPDSIHSDNVGGISLEVLGPVAPSI